MLINPKDLNEALQWDSEHEFKLHSSTGDDEYVSLRRKPSYEYVYWLSHIDIYAYHIGAGDLALWVHENLPNFNAANYPTYLNYVRIGQGGSGRQYESVNDVLLNETTLQQTIPVNKLFKKGWRIILEVLDLSYISDESIAEIGVQIFTFYKAFKTKPNEFGQMDDLMTKSRFLGLE